MQLAAEEQRSGAITTRYSAELADNARHALSELRSTMPDAVHDDSDRRQASAALDSLDRAIRALDGGMAR